MNHFRLSDSQLDAFSKSLRDKGLALLAAGNIAGHQALADAADDLHARRMDGAAQRSRQSQARRKTLGLRYSR